MQKGLVSVCSPCYNVGPYIHRFLESLLAQTYKSLEIILVNDGSTDNTEEVITSYLPRLETEGYQVVYLTQENAGQSAAVNLALKYTHGEFLTWPDPDDWWTPDFIEKQVAFLRSKPEVALVRSNIACVREANDAIVNTFESVERGDFLIENFAEKLAFVKTWYAPVACMIRMSAFLQVNPQKEIYTTKAGGQNLQMMLPLAYHFPCWQRAEVLGFYLIRANSHSHCAKTLEEKLAYIDMREDIYLHEVGKLRDVRDQWSKRIIRNNALERYNLAMVHGDKTKAQKQFSMLTKMEISSMEKVKLYLRTYIIPQILQRAYAATRKVLAMAKQRIRAMWR